MDNNKITWRLGKLLDNRYEIVSVLGIGGMAVVYKAVDTKLKRNVAVKVLRDHVAMDAESRRRFSTEYQAVAMLSHPNIRAVYDVVSSGDTEYIVMEYVDGINLKQYLNKKGALGWRETLHFSIQIARALNHAHSRSIIHMDIKPQNIMLPKDGTVKIADFGIARWEEAPPASSDSDEAVGSIHYISPEQARGEAVDARSDIYSLGVVMYEMLTGKLPFEGESVAEVAVKHYTVMPDAPTAIDPEIPAELEAITLKAMQPDPDDRYSSAAEMLADLEDFRKRQTAVANRAGARVLTNTHGLPVRDEIHVITRNVPRISKSGELSREGYVRRRSRAGTVSMLLGFGIVIAFALGLFIFVWRSWLKDIFSDAERTDIPAFVGQDVDDVVNNPELKELFDFKVEYQATANYAEGTIMEQKPDAGSSRMIVTDGIEVDLVVSSGIQLVELPDDVINSPYTDVQVRLQDMGLNVMIEKRSSDTITENYVVDMVPAPGTSVSSGSDVTVYVSAGPSVIYATVPNIIGMQKAAALLALQREGLICSESEIQYVSSSAQDSGKVVWQSYAGGTEVVSGTPIYLQIGTGPAMGPTPEPAPTQPPEAAPPPQA